MLKFDNNDLNKKCKEIKYDIKNKEITSKAWPWMMFGALAGLLASCIKKNIGSSMYSFSSIKKKNIGVKK